jgi:hypothetical protein
MKALQSPVITYTELEQTKRYYKGILGVRDISDNNEIATPLDLARRQVKQIPDKSGKILIPCAGIGTYILACLLEGIQPEQITAVELKQTHGEFGSGIFSRLGVNYVIADYLDWKTKMKFDVIIGNPPYQKGKYSDFYVCFLRRVEKHLKEGGYFSYLMPAKGVNPLSRAQPVLDKCGWNDVELGVEKFFPNIGTVIARYSGIKGSKSESINVTVDGRSFDIDRGTVLPLTNQDPIAFSIVQKIFGHQNKMPYYRAKSEPKGNYVYTSRMVGTWHPEKDKGGAYSHIAYVNWCGTAFDGGFIDCDNEEQAEHIQWLISRSLAMRFAVNQCGKAAFIPPLFWSYTPDIRNCKTDDDILTQLNFTPEEVSYLKTWETQVYKNERNNSNGDRKTKTTRKSSRKGNG